MWDLSFTAAQCLEAPQTWTKAAKPEPHSEDLGMGVSENGGYLILGVLITRILLFRVLYWDPLFLETPRWRAEKCVADYGDYRLSGQSPYTNDYSVLRNRF